MIQELHAGDRQIPASGWNEMRAAVQGLTLGQQQYQSGKLNPVYITVKNVTGSDLPAFSVVKLSGVTYSRTSDTFINQAIAHGVELTGDTPTGIADAIAITQAACPSGGFVKALASGATACFVNRPSGIACKYAKPATSHTGYLEGTDTPTNIQVLGVASGTGIKEAYIRLGTYNPQYLAFATVTGTAGSGDAYATIDGVQYYIRFPGPNDGLSATNYPDIYPGDEILVLVDIESNECYGVDYPTDYEAGTLMAFYSGQGSPGRGWDAITTDPAMTAAGFTLYQKSKTGAIL